MKPQLKSGESLRKAVKDRSKAILRRRDERERRRNRVIDRRIAEFLDSLDWFGSYPDPVDTFLWRKGVES